MNVGIKRCGGRGFTLVEILVVIVIVGILLAMSLGLHGRVKSKQIESRLLTEMAAIELALEGYKAKHGQYPASDPWSVNYPSVKWVPGLIYPQNTLYRDLCQNEGKPFLADASDKQIHKDSSGVETGALTASVSTVDDQKKPINLLWYYNAYDPKYNKNSFDLWVEYGDYGKDGKANTNDDIVRIISNWTD
ncbi:MAG: prepilin-type N-terminal cleavage/methylation domain-containing protein [Verrucomicrobiota bacterium]|nr:prepilin-type N-terminal cleavage/methylation domain-containing protein [Verrucomicrobiota bacterium]